MANIRGLLLLPLGSILFLGTNLYASVELAGSVNANADRTQEKRENSGAASKSFRWISATREKTLFEQVRTAFAEELKPDARGDASPEAIHYRYLARVGVGGKTALVIIGNRNDMKVREFDFFDVYSFDRRIGSKKKIVAASPFYLLRYKLSAHFESGKMPDLIFEYQNCVECEPATLLASFGMTNDTWSLRTWTGQGNSLGLGGVQDPEDGKAELMDHAYRVGDFEQKGKDQIVVWVRLREIATDDSGKIYSESNSTFVYSLRNGILQKEDISVPSRVSELHSWICETDAEASICQSGH